MNSAPGLRTREALFWAVAAASLLPFVSGGLALAAGIAAAFLLEAPSPDVLKGWASRLLSWSIIALGAGMDLAAVARAGGRGIGYTFAGICATLSLGFVLGRLLSVAPGASTLISVGTAICGGSAIAAAAPAIRAKSEEISIAMATVFLLNAAALFIFPPLGRHFGLDQTQFGLWCALAIHDTSSVVAAAFQYGPRAAEVATTVKLARALWIVPVTLLVGALHSRADGAGGKAKRPWFVLGFLAAAALVHFVPALKPAGHWTAWAGRRALCLALFLTGAGIRPQALRTLGPRPFAQGFILWIFAAVASLAAIRSGLIAL